jgi:uncharacterized membrane protein YccC
MSPVIPDHVKNQAPGKRASRWARRQELESRHREQEARRRAEEEARTPQPSSREACLAAVLEHVQTEYQERLARLGDPVVAKSSVYLELQTVRKQVSSEHVAIVDEAWRKFNAQLVAKT